ncbi:hypothetical protein DUI87_30629 [Hirundo rustica rustica]|uniref:Core shell protein Gag P30 domain-containing protein n=1 Tax=Hirundo rustica rustica TaxID=333673 RepID=A0A3M0IUC5_HIRRU|nr:hypothetical protein DUI87_30629 [Hirundo rustica rustica]
MANPEQRPIGDVSVPLNTGDVREFKKEMGRLLEDPLGVPERLDQFLRLNIYTWVELQSILGILFTMEERDMIRHSGMRLWDRECQGPDQGDQKWPMQDPGWNNQNERHRQNMSDLRWMIIRGIREAVPKGPNIRKALSENQGKDEALADWLEILRKALQLYSGVDPDTAAGQVLLKTQLVAKSWGHIRKKVEKVEIGQDRGLQELLREAQKVYVRRDEEKKKVKTTDFNGSRQGNTDNHEYREVLRKEQTTEESRSHLWGYETHVLFLSPERTLTNFLSYLQGKIWKERGFINTQRKGLVHQGLIIQVLKALKSPKKIEVVHVNGLQRGRNIRTRRNNLADDEAKKAALRENSNVIMTFEEADENGNDPSIGIEGTALRQKEENQKETKEIRKKAIGKDLKEVDKLYEQFKQQYSDRDVITSAKNLFVDLMQEIATELGLSKCWICGNG